MALAFPEVAELPHFQKISFRVKKKIFATLSASSCIASVKLSLVDQSVFCSIDKTIIYPVPNKWGLQGWTHINLEKIKKTMLQDILQTSFSEVLLSHAKKNKQGFFINNQ